MYDLTWASTGMCHATGNKNLQTYWVPNVQHLFVHSSMFMLCLLCFRRVKQFAVSDSHYTVDDAMETRQAEWGTESLHNWQLNGRILTSLTGHKGNCARVRACACVSVKLNELWGKELERERIWVRVFQLAVKVHFRGFRIKAPPITTAYQ